jgi:hypothetical protein
LVASTEAKEMQIPHHPQDLDAEKFENIRFVGESS